LLAVSKTPRSPLVTAAEEFDAALQRFAALTEAARKGPLDSQKTLERAGATLSEIATCEQDLQARAGELMAALAGARDAQQTQAEAVRLRALEIQKRTEEYAAVLRNFEALGHDAAELNAAAQKLAARGRSAEEMVKDGELLAGLDEMQERMVSVAARAEALTAGARAADFADLAGRIDSLRQQILAARNKVGLLKEALARATPPSRPS
jgi:hypothetical protein